MYRLTIHFPLIGTRIYTFYSLAFAASMLAHIPRGPNGATAWVIESVPGDAPFII